MSLGNVMPAIGNAMPSALKHVIESGDQNGANWAADGAARARAALLSGEPVPPQSMPTLANSKIDIDDLLKKLKRL